MNLLEYVRLHRLLDEHRVEVALQRQQIYGGSFDTVLLEQQVVDPIVLDDLLTRATGLPAVGVQLLDSVVDRPWHLVPRDVLELGWVMPLAVSGEGVQVAVHPEIPDSFRDQVLHKVVGVRLMVTAECCLARLSAERTSSVIPQRYAVLALTYSQALRRQAVAAMRARQAPAEPVAAPWMRGPQSTQAHVGAPAHVPPQDPAAFAASSRHSAADEQRRAAMDRVHEGPVFAPPGEAGRGRTQIMYAMPPRTDAAHTEVPPNAYEDVDLEESGPIDLRGPTLVEGRLDRITVSDVGSTLDPRELEVTLETPAWTPVPTPDVTAETRALDRDELDVTDESAAYDGVESTAHDEEPAPPAEPVHEPVSRERMAAAIAEVRTSRHRDAITGSLVSGAALVTPRVALFGVRRDGLRALGSGPGLPGMEGTAVPRSDRLGRSLAGTEPMTMTLDLDLRLAVQLEDAVPCALLTVEVVGRPVLALYADRAGEPLSDTEIGQLRALCDAAGTSLEDVLKRRRAETAPELEASETPSGAPPAAGAPSPTEYSISPGRNDAEPVTLTQKLEAPPVRVRTPTGEQPPTVVPTTDPADDAPPRFDGNVPKLVDPPPRRTTTLIGQRPGVSQARREAPQRDSVPLEPTTLTSTGPGPSPPPPSTSRIPTLKPGTAPPPPDPDITEEHPRFEPPPKSNEPRIISLDKPIRETPTRGQIHLEDEDRVRERSVPADSMEARIDGALDAAMAGRTSVKPLIDMGEPALLRVAAQFPGTLDVFRRDLDALPPLAAHGPLIRVVVSMGQVMTPHIVELMDHPNVNVRFYAAFVFQELRDERAIPGLGELSFDPDQDVRTIAARVLETYSRSVAFEATLAKIRRELDSANRARQLFAVRAVGTLRDIRAVPMLIELLGSRDRHVQEGALEALCSITGQQLGLKAHRWRTWYQEAANQHRVEWIIGSLHHKDIAVRRWAADELRRVTGQPFVFPAAGSKIEREAAIRQWENWWAVEGRGRLLGN